MTFKRKFLPGAQDMSDPSWAPFVVVCPYSSPILS